MQSADLMAKERQIRENLRIERNKEIEIVISKLEEQAALQKEESQATLDCRMKRMKDKYESQVRREVLRLWKLIRAHIWDSGW